jgi:hypothetical protein
LEECWGEELHSFDGIYSIKESVEVHKLIICFHLLCSKPLDILVQNVVRLTSSKYPRVCGAFLGRSIDNNSFCILLVEPFQASNHRLEGKVAQVRVVMVVKRSKKTWLLVFCGFYWERWIFTLSFILGNEGKICYFTPYLWGRKC